MSVKIDQRSADISLTLDKTYEIPWLFPDFQLAGY